MKGIVFTEFMDHVEAHHGAVVLDDIIEASDTETDGAYTSIGTYPCEELVRLIAALSRHSGDAVSDIIVQFGETLALSFKRKHPHYFDNPDYFDFVEGIEHRIHVDVLKLYPDAELPSFVTIDRSEDTLVVDYISSRNLEHLALGLLKGTARHFDEDVEIDMKVFDQKGRRVVRFTIDRG